MLDYIWRRRIIIGKYYLFKLIFWNHFLRKVYMRAWGVLLGYIYEGDGSGYWDISLDFLTLVERNENSLSWNLFFMKWKTIVFFCENSIKKSFFFLEIQESITPSRSIAGFGTGDRTKADEWRVGGGVIFNPKIHIADFGPLYRALKRAFREINCNMIFLKWECGGQRPFGIFPKFIRFGTVARPWAVMFLLKN